MPTHICCVCEEPFSTLNKGVAKYCSKQMCQEARTEKARDYSRCKMREHRKNNEIMESRGRSKLKAIQEKDELSMRVCLWCLGRLTVKDVENGYRYYHPIECHARATNYAAFGFEGC